MEENLFNPVIERNFSYHKPTDETIPKYELMREMYKQAAYLILDNCPASKERNIAIEKLEESMMWANSSIARHSSQESQLENEFKANLTE